MNEKLSQTSIKPFLKWAGGKTQILEEIRAKYPIQLGKSIKKYAEPFVGGGAVLFDVLNRHNLKTIYISDINRELILTYSAIKNNINGFIRILKTLEKDYLSASDTDKTEIYYKNREIFNSLKRAKSKDIEIAALFIFLNKTCFNGLYRVNAQGGFNVPLGKYKTPRICDEYNS